MNYEGMFARDFPFSGERKPPPVPSGYATGLNCRGSSLGGSVIFGSELTEMNYEPTYRVFQIFGTYLFAGLPLFQGEALYAPPDYATV